MDNKKPIIITLSGSKIVDSILHMVKLEINDKYKHTLNPEDVVHIAHNICIVFNECVNKMISENMDIISSALIMESGLDELTDYSLFEDQELHPKNKSKSTRIDNVTNNNLTKH